jgi:Transposase DDE domain
MVPEEPLLVAFVALIDGIPAPPPGPARRGRPPAYTDRLFLKALVVMVLKRLPTVHALLAVLDQPTPEMRQVRQMLTEGGHFPSRRTWERRLAALPAALPAQIACLGDELVRLLGPWRDRGRAVAIDSTVLAARGGVWHKRHREAGVVPHTSIDTEAHWTKSGWHGWVYGWKLHLVVTVAGVWIPLRAALTPANAADNEQAAALLTDLPAEIRFVLGDSHYQDPALHDLATAGGWTLVANRRGPYPHDGGGVEVRRVFHEERSRAIENFNGQFKAIFAVGGPVPTRGLAATARWALGAVLVYQLTLLQRHHRGLDLRTGLKPFLQAA